MKTRTHSLTRREFAGLLTALGAAGCGDAPATASDAEPFKLAETTVAELGSAMAEGRLTSRAICELYLDRIESIDRSGPTLKSVIEINPDALKIADKLDADRAAGRVHGPLHGVPVMLKDNIDTGDKMQTTAGSLALIDSGVKQDSWVADRLRAAGAVILAKTNLSEWANFRSNDSTSGWSGRGGLTKNPYALDRNACGSSSGSGVAVSANLTALAIGTETNGSVVCPSSINGIVGIKPTVGLVGRSGIVPISHSQDTAGPMARTVADAAALLGVLTGLDSRDAITASSRGNSHEDYTQFLNAEGLRGARIGVLQGYWGERRAMDQVLDAAVASMKAAGAELVDIEKLPGLDGIGKSAFEVMLYEFKADLNSYLSALSPQAKVHSLAEVIAFNEEHRDEELPYFDQGLMKLAEEKGPLTDPAYIEALRKCQGLSRTAIDETVKEHTLDALFAPTTGPAWVTDLLHGDRSGFPSSSSPAARAGYPNITVPGGFVGDLPMGVSFFGKAYSEPKLIEIASGFEAATKIRREPTFLPTV